MRFLRKPDFLKVKELKERWGVCSKTVYRRFNRYKKILDPQKHGNAYRVTAANVAKFEDQSRVVKEEQNDV